MAQLPPYLWEIKDQIERYAHDFGLDFFETIFEILSYDEMNMVAARGGFPVRYPHWRFGMEYEKLSKSHTYGLSKIYEMVINNDPSYAYLLEGNSTVDQKTVISHVYAHVDFFKNNYYFKHTNRKMIDEMANHATRIRKYIERYGLDAVEGFIDRCYSLDNLIDYHAPYITRRAPPIDEEASSDPVSVAKIPTKDYLDAFVNPQKALDAERKKLEAERDKKKMFPAQPERDILQFLIENAPCEKWQRDVLSIIREESYYFAPQGMTKVINEGWASFWHSNIMTQKAATSAEIIDFADQHSGVTATSPGRVNPYKLGLELLRHIEERWNKGQFGREWDDCDDMEARLSWDKGLGLGRQKVFEVRKHYNDVTFIDEFFTEDFMRDQGYYVFGFNRRQNRYEITSKEFREVKSKLLDSLTNFGQPVIAVIDGNFENRSELLLRHRHEGTDLKLDYARDTLSNLHFVWKRPVHILTKVENNGKIISFNGKDHSEKSATYT
jgi:stage V sporulation protein R